MRQAVAVLVGALLLGGVAAAADYDLGLYDADGAELAYSDEIGTSRDYVTATAGSADDGTDWRISVIHYSGDPDAGYTLYIYVDDVLESTFTEVYEDDFLLTVSTGQKIEAELYPNEDASSDCGVAAKGLPGFLAVFAPLGTVFLLIRRRPALARVRS